MADMTTAEKLSKVYEGVERVEELNAELEQTLYGTDTGGKSYYDAFWDEFQDNGTRTAYDCAFWGWNGSILRPKHNINIIGSGNSVFRKVKGIADFDKWQKDCGIFVDFSNATVTSDCFGATEFEKIGVLDFSKVSNMTWCFAHSKKLKIIEKIKIGSQNTSSFVGMFDGCSALEELRIEGVIAMNSFSLSHSPKLNKASITSIINALSTTTSGLTVALSKKAVNKAFETTTSANDGATSAEWTALEETKKNWTISLV